MALYIFKDAVLNYASVTKYKLEYQKDEVKGKPFMFKEYVVDALLTTAEIKKLKKTFGKKLKAIKEMRVMDAAGYLKAYKVEVPDDDRYVNDDGEYHVMKIRRKAYYKNSEEAIPKELIPKLVGKLLIRNEAGKATGSTDLEGSLIKSAMALGNGSLANVSAKVRTYNYKGVPGVALDMITVQVLNLVEYETDDGMEYGDYEGNDHDAEQDEDEGDGFGDHPEGDSDGDDEDSGSDDEGTDEGSDEDWND